jgi:hypothetical protein
MEMAGWKRWTKEEECLLQAANRKHERRMGNKWDAIMKDPEFKTITTGRTTTNLWNKLRDMQDKDKARQARQASTSGTAGIGQPSKWTAEEVEMLAKGHARYAARTDTWVAVRGDPDFTLLQGRTLKQMSNKWIRLQKSNRSTPAPVEQARDYVFEPGDHVFEPGDLDRPRFFVSFVNLEPDDARTKTLELASCLHTFAAAAPMETITLHYGEGHDVWGGELVLAIGTIANLRGLEIVHGNPSAGVDVLEGLRELNALQRIIIGTGDFRGGLGRALDPFPELRSLSLCGADSRTMQSISEKESIEELFIQSAMFGDEGLLCLARMRRLNDVRVRMSDKCKGEVTAAGVNSLLDHSSLMRLVILDLPDSFAYELVDEEKGGVSVHIACRKA